MLDDLAFRIDLRPPANARRPGRGLLGGGDHALRRLDEVPLKHGVAQVGESLEPRPEAVTAAGGEPSLCIVNFNGGVFLGPTLDAAVSQADAFGEILFVDNGSHDDSVAIARRYEGLRVVELGENRGASAVRNAALELAAADLVLLIDSDVRLAAGCASRLAEAHASDPRVAVAMPRVLYDDDPDRIQFDGADWHFLGLQTLHHADAPAEGAPDEPREIGSVITACCLVDRTKVGRAPFDEDFFIYLEDHDFGVRVRSAGYAILSVPAARCYHAEGTPGLSIRALGAYSPMRVFCMIRNRWQFIAKNYSCRTLILLAPLLAVFELSQLAGAVGKGWLRHWARAAGWMIRHGPEVIRRRRHVQSARQRPDRELVSAGPIPFRPELAAGWLERRAQAWLDRLAAAYWRRIGPLV